MRKKLKILIIIPTITIGFVLFLYFKNPFKVKAESPIVCTEPIPIGVTIEKTQNLLDELYQKFEKLRDFLDIQVSVATQIVGEITNPTDSNEVCDFSKCVPPPLVRLEDVSETGLGRNESPELEIAITTGVPGVDVSLAKGTFCVGICASRSCLENPCPDLTKYQQLIKKIPQETEDLYNEVKELLLSKKYPITSEIKKEKEVIAENQLNLLEYLKRYLELSRDWLTISGPAGEKISCVMTELERKKFEAGKGEWRGPRKCLTALEEGNYWPRAWSENCKRECQKWGIPSQECKECLAKCEGSSFLAKINCKIYSDSKKGGCQSYCWENPFSGECLECICKGLSPRECQAYLCGGSVLNWVCCSEAPLEHPPISTPTF